VLAFCWLDAFSDVSKRSIGCSLGLFDATHCGEVGLVVTGCFKCCYFEFKGGKGRKKYICSSLRGGNNLVKVSNKVQMR
jgi:hypothetical protein